MVPVLVLVTALVLVLFIIRSLVVAASVSAGIYGYSSLPIMVLLTALVLVLFIISVKKNIAKHPRTATQLIRRLASFDSTWIIPWSLKDLFEVMNAFAEW